MQLLVEMLVLFLFAKIIGETFRHYGFSPLVGEVLAGVILGPAVLGVVPQHAQLEAIAMFGLIILMLTAGMNSRFDMLARVRFKSTVISSVGVIFSLGFGIFSGYLCTGEFLSALFIGAVLSNTATEVVVRFTAKSHLSHLVASAALIDDILAIYMLGLVSTVTLKQALGVPADLETILWVTVGIIAFFLAVVYSSKVLVVKSNIMRRLWRLKGGSLPVTFAVVLAMTLAVIARYVGMHEIIGAYMAGLFIGRLRERPDALLLSRIRLNALLDDVSNVLQAVLTPFFFAYIGLLFPSLSSVNLIILAIILLTAFSGKIIGSGLGAAMVGYNRRDSLRTGVAMCARGSLELAMVQFGYATGILSADIYSAMVITVMTTAIVSPVIFKLIR